MNNDISVNNLASQIYAAQKKIGVWNDFEGGEIEFDDIPRFFASLHARVSAAYEKYEETTVEGGDFSEIKWQEPGSVIETTEEEGIPDGFPIDLGAVVFDLLGLMKRIGVDPGDVLGKMARAQAKFGGIEDFEGAEESEETISEVPPAETPSSKPVEPASTEKTENAAQH
jgi:hypothetical protein